MTFRQHSVQCASPSGLHRMAYTEWGDRANPRVVICVHGLTRNGRDFDTLAAALSPHFRVICPDVVGRGQSDRLTDPNGYAIPQYLADMVTLIARLNVDEVHWVGTSMGGLIGMFLASMDSTPVRRLVLNDVGPTITTTSLARIGDYLGSDPTWSSFAEAMVYTRFICAPFGALTEAQWQHLTEHSVAQRADGRWGFVYDPAIAAPFKQNFSAAEIDLWPVYERIAARTLVIRGSESDLLTRETWQQMGVRGPRAALAEIAGVGHAPMFLSDDQVTVVSDFLLAA